jgi:F5/8 type C domain/Alpha-L-fucosidase
MLNGTWGVRNRFWWLRFGVVIAALVGTTATLRSSPSSAARNIGSSAVTRYRNSDYGVFISYGPRGGIDPIPAPNETWSDALKRFDVETLADNVEGAGADYVVFHENQTSGYYVSPIPALKDANGSPGQYSPADDFDLIKELGTALNKRGIQLYVYLAVDGPTRSPSDYGSEAIRQQYPADMAESTLNEANRQKLKKLVTDWGNSWGSLVSGWWFDGCFEGTAYNGPREGGQPNYELGKKYVDELFAAAKAGNDDRIVTCNPGNTLAYGLSDQADYVTGEEIELHRFPNTRDPARVRSEIGSKTLEWNVTSFLGSNWGRSDTRFDPVKVARYVYAVVRDGGNATFDVGYSSNGSLYNPHVEQLALAHRMIADGSNNSWPASKNLALFHKSWFQANEDSAAMIAPETSYPLPFNGAEFEHFASYANDGGFDNRLVAQAGGRYNYSYVLDMARPETFRKFVVQFDQTNYPAKFYVDVYDGTSWKTVHYGEPGGGERNRYRHVFDAPITAQYVRIRSDGDGPDIGGGKQMAISELKLFADVDAADGD